MKRSLEQLRSQVWLSREAAEKDLKRSGIPSRGSDYELREAEPGAGNWMIMELDESSEPSVPEVTQLPSRPARGTKLSPQAKPLRKTAAKPEAPPDAEAQPEPDKAPDEPKPPAPGTDLSPLPTQAGPYMLAFDAEHVRQTSPVAQALEVSQRMRLPVVVMRAYTFETARLVDAVAVKTAQKANRARSGGGGRVGMIREDSKQRRAITLLLRDEGATADELSRVTGGPIGQRHINRFAKIAKATIDHVATKHWRLVKPQA